LQQQLTTLHQNHQTLEQETQALRLAQANAVAAAVARNLLPNPVAFALDPARALTGTINFADTAGAKVYKMATAPLAVMYDGTVKTLRPMLHHMERRINKFKAIKLITFTSTQNTDAAGVFPTYNLIS